jgi:hypothetical protein
MAFKRVEAGKGNSCGQQPTAKCLRDGFEQIAKLRARIGSRFL